VRQSIILSSFINFFVNFIVLVLFAHPQINNRALTANPLLYIYCADEIIKFAQNKSVQGFFIISFFVVFSVLSCIMQTGSYGFA
jgi:Gpi18-like mannosyltransferase